MPTPAGRAPLVRDELRYAIWLEIETLAMEAMAAGKPVLATRVGSLEDVIENGENGYLTESGDAEKMTNRLLSLFQDGVDATAIQPAAH